MLEFEIVTAANNNAVLSQNLLASPMLASGKVPTHIQRGYDSAARAYNSSLSKVKADIVVFAHQDVYFPAGWELQLEESVAKLEEQLIPWAVLGVWGVNAARKFSGRVWCSGGNHELVGSDRVNEVCSIDEIVIVLRRSSGLSFDDQLPGFHLYATDLVLTALSSGFTAHAITAPVVHNSRWNANVFDAAYIRGYRYMKRKWKDSLPLQTCCLPVTRWSWPLARRLIRQYYWRLLGRTTGGYRRSEAEQLAKDLGYEQVSQA